LGDYGTTTVLVKRKDKWYHILMSKLYTNKGNEILFTNYDYTKLKDIHWEETIESKTGRLSNVKRRYTENGVRKAQSLTRFLLGNEHSAVDHINRNPLDNRRSNLRICTVQQNCCNRGRADAKEYRGVYFEKRRANRKSGNAWRAIVVFNQKPHYAGYFPSEILAAKAYDVLASKLHGEFASLNFPKKK